MKTLKQVLSLIIGIAFGIGGTLFVESRLIPNDFKFYNPIPIFSQQQEDVVRNTICKALMLVDKPSEYYVSNIIIGDTIVLSLSKLFFLQDGSNSNGTMLSITTGGSKMFLFDKNYNLINK